MTYLVGMTALKQKRQWSSHKCSTATRELSKVSIIPISPSAHPWGEGGEKNTFQALSAVQITRPLCYIHTTLLFNTVTKHTCKVNYFIICIELKTLFWTIQCNVRSKLTLNNHLFELQTEKYGDESGVSSNEMDKLQASVATGSRPGTHCMHGKSVVAVEHVDFYSAGQSGHPASIKSSLVYRTQRGKRKRPIRSHQQHYIKLKLFEFQIWCRHGKVPLNENSGILMKIFCQQ